mmetsp:Transcript_41876/g.65434  ORF Transcript_41876/g.65434 Transcript_41876/m.65434 type:complete len:302 (+) Transcript_41876:993-1898(+)
MVGVLWFEMTAAARKRQALELELTSVPHYGCFPSDHHPRGHCRPSDHPNDHFHLPLLPSDHCPCRSLWKSPSCRTSRSCHSCLSSSGLRMRCWAGSGRKIWLSPSYRPGPMCPSRPTHRPPLKKRHHRSLWRRCLKSHTLHLKRRTLRGRHSPRQSPRDHRIHCDRCTHDRRSPHRHLTDLYLACRSPACHPASGTCGCRACHNRRTSCCCSLRLHSFRSRRCCGLGLGRSSAEGALPSSPGHPCLSAAAPPLAANSHCLWRRRRRGRRSSASRCSRPSHARGTAAPGFLREWRTRSTRRQ